SRHLAAQPRGIPASLNSCFRGGRSSERRHALPPGHSQKEFRVPPLFQRLQAATVFHYRSATAAPRNRCSLPKTRLPQEQSQATRIHRRRHPSEKTYRATRVRWRFVARVPVPPASQAPERTLRARSKVARHENSPGLQSGRLDGLGARVSARQHPASESPATTNRATRLLHPDRRRCVPLVREIRRMLRLHRLTEFFHQE